MKTIDLNVINRHLEELEEALTYLESKKNITEKDIAKNIELRLAVERALHLAIQNTIDIGNHIIASLAIHDVETYAEIPQKLAEANIIPKRLSENLVNMAKFRNLLVHEYVKLESARLVSFIKHNLNDFLEFSQAMSKHLKGSKKKS